MRIGALVLAALLPGAAAAGGTATVLFGGDTHMGESYAVGVDLLRSKGYDHAFGGLDALLGSAELVVANLETPVTTRTDSTLRGKKSFLHHADPVLTPEALVRHRIDAVSLANNHAMDQGVPGMLDTLAALARVGLPVLGAGRDAAAAARPFVRELPVGSRVVRLAVVGGFEEDARHAAYGFYAGPARPGVQGWTAGSAREHLARIRREEPGAFLVAFPHWGRNYAPPAPSQRATGPALVRGGADLVLGHGAHVYQELEAVDGRWIVHGLGNFVFNTSGRFEEGTVEPFSLVARLVFEEAEGGVRARLLLTPIRSMNPATGYRPVPAAPEEADRIGAKLKLPATARRGQDAFGPVFELPLGPVPSRPATP